MSITRDNKNNSYNVMTTISMTTTGVGTLRPTLLMKSRLRRDYDINLDKKLFRVVGLIV